MRVRGRQTLVPDHVFPSLWSIILLSIVFFWVLTPCGLLYGYQCFGGTYHLHRQSPENEGIILFRNVDTKSILCHNPEDHHELRQSLENLKTQIFFLSYCVIFVLFRAIRSINIESNASLPKIRSVSFFRVSFRNDQKCWCIFTWLEVINTWNRVVLHSWWLLRWSKIYHASYVTQY